MTVLERYQSWLDDSALDAALRQELECLTEQQIRDRFYSDITFGTAGLRGIVAAGANCMNTKTVAIATQALSLYLKEEHLGQQGVVIARDPRKNSDVFSDLAAKILCANGIPVYSFEEITPVPLLSYSIRALGCDAGIAITASHNPPEYNGYKVYASYGGQLDPQGCTRIMWHMQRLSLSDVLQKPLEHAASCGLFHRIGPELLNAYCEQVLAQSVLQESAGDLKIVYTPLHGAGAIPVLTLLQKAGFTHIDMVAEQRQPDANFAAAPNPNPEDPSTMQLAVQLAERTDADLVLGTDPDADRLACGIRTPEGIQLLTGNQTACLLLYYLLSTRAERGDLPQNGLIVRSIVSTALADRIAEHFGCHVVQTLTGFRYISALISAAQEDGTPFLFGFEESAGFLAYDLSRDKDAVSSALLLCSAACYYRAKGKSLAQVLDEIYAIFGAHVEKSYSYTFAGAEGAAKIEALMQRCRENPPAQLGNIPVCIVEDYLCGTRTQNGITTPLAMPKSNVLLYRLQGGSWACLRPSGTEPKFKLYLQATGSTDSQAHVALQGILASCLQLLGLQDEPR